jgi:dihydrofolate synthase/folylpolyglutamate synthase
VTSPTPDARAALLSLEQIGIKLGLDQIRALVDALGRPDRAFPSTVVAGTNGKGSVTAMLDRGLRAAGLRTGRYTSPHLVALEERFAIDGRDITTETFDAAARRVLAASAALPAPPSFFEATTALALDVFREARVDVAVLEVGLGGRLDATNVVSSVAVAITAVDFDHEAFLGHTIEAIAREKAGVIKPNGLVVLAPNPPAVETIVSETCEERGARLLRAADVAVESITMDAGQAVVTMTTPRRRYDGLRLALRGRHQIDNARTAIRLLEALDETGRFAIDEAAIRTAIEDVVWPGRLELVRSAAGEILIDGAHNPAGARALAAYVLETYGRRLPLVVAIMHDKQIDTILTALAPAAACFVCTAPETPRAARPEDLALAALRVAPDLPVSTAPDPIAAIRRAAVAGSPVVVAGSLYLAGDVRAHVS